MHLWYNCGMEKTKVETRSTETVTISSAEYERLKKLEEETEWMANRITWLEEQLKVLAKSHFGSKHETASDEVIGQMMLFDEPEVYAYLEEIRKQTTTVAGYERTNKKEKIFLLDNLPVNAEVVEEKHELSEEERTCPVCGSVMESAGEEVVRTLEIQPSKFVVHEDHYVNYVCKNCNGEDTEDDIGKTQFIKTPHVPMVYPGSNCSPSAAAFLMTEKFVMGSPLYRMAFDLNSSVTFKCFLNNVEHRTYKSR